MAVAGLLIGAGVSAALFGGFASGGAGSAGMATESAAAGSPGADDLAAILLADNSAGRAAPPAAAARNVPSVDVMIARLQRRLADTPDDAEGWRMLGWSQMHLGRHDEAIRAYRRANELAPGDPAIAAALEQALASRRQGRVAATPEAPPDIPTGHPGQPPEAATELERWALRIRSWAFVGDQARARQALADAMQAFAGDPQARAALARMARSYGVRTE